MRLFGKQLILCVFMALAGVSLMLAGCSDGAQENDDVVPRVKCFEVGEQATGQVRRFSGRVVAADSFPLSFGVGGTVSQVVVSQGDRVERGQLLASLDKQPLTLAVEKARAQVVLARETVVNSQRQFEQVTELFDKQAATRLELDTVTTELATARGNLQSAQADLDQRTLDLERAELTAPTAGVVAARTVDPFEEVTAGGQVFVLQTDGAFKVEVRVPETLIRDIAYGQPVQVEFPTLDGVTAAGHVLTIGAQAESGNAYPVDIQLQATGADLRMGMTASVSFRFDEYLDGRRAYMIPISAISVKAELVNERRQAGVEVETKEGLVFVFNESAGRVEERRVVIGGLRGNSLEVFEGLEAGDRVVIAGVAFLRDKMSAELWDAQRGLSDG